MRVQVRTVRGLCLAVVLASVVGLADASEDAAAIEPVVEQNIQRVAEHAVRGGAVEVPGVSCGSVCQEWWVEEHRPIPGRPTSEELHRQLRTLRSKTRVLPFLRALGTVGLAVDVGHIGWKIGNLARTKLLKIGVPEPIEGPIQTQQWDERIEFHQAGGRLGLWSLTPLPVDGFYWSHYSPYYSHQRSSEFKIGGADGCFQAQPPAGLSVEVSSFIGSCGGESTRIAVAYQPEDALSAPAPIEDYTNQPYAVETPSWPDAPTTAADAEDRVRAHLEQHPVAEAWYCHQLDSQICDPVQRESSRDRCELSSPLNRDPHPERGGDPPLNDAERAARYEPVPNALWPQEGVVPAVAPSATSKVHLRYGWTEASDNPLTRWVGPGYRKIAAKHGWSSSDIAASIAALQDPSPEQKTRVQSDESFTYWIYDGPQYTGRDGAVCRRRVVVEFEPRGSEAQAGLPAMSMISSYGREF